MESPIILSNGPRLVKRVLFDEAGGATLQHLTITQEVSLTAGQLEALVECLPLSGQFPPFRWEGAADDHA